MRYILIFILLVVALSSRGQFSNRIWCFGDSAGLDFSNLNTPQLFTSAGDSRGSCCSIADSSHNLLFYAHSDWNLWWNAAGCACAQKIENKDHLTMLNGDSLIGEILYDQLVIIPFPNDSNKFYLFHLAAFGFAGLYYSVIDLSLDNGRGAVVQKNVLITNLIELSCAVTAVKNGNGRDWWILFRPSYVQTGGAPTNEYYIVAITPNGVQIPVVQSIGSINSTDRIAMAFSSNGSKLSFVNYLGLVEVYDFDRCTGILSNPQNIYPETINPPYNSCRGAIGTEFSSNDLVLYVSTNWHPSKLLQYDLTASNITSSEYIAGNIAYPSYAGGEIRRASDNKIYWTCAWNDGMHNNYPYQDSVYNMYNMNLSFVNSPNLLGSACFFQPFSYFLGWKRTYYGLPNNPDFNMPAWGGSLCDTLGYPNLISSNSKVENTINIFYHNEWQAAFINAYGLKGKIYAMHVVTIEGKEIYYEGGELNSSYYTKDFRCNELSNGTYIVLIETDKERLVKKFMKE